MSAVIEHKPQQSLLAKFAGKYGIEPNRMLVTLKATAFRQRDGADVTNEQMMALLIVADQYGMNPWTKEIYAFPDKGGIVPVVGVDGWLRIINEHPMFDGVEFVEHESDKGAPDWIECVIHRKDRAHAIRAREFFSECRRDTQPWKSHPRRMLRHKALIQCARIAFGFAGIHDPDEAQQIIDMGTVQPEPAMDAVADINATLGARRAAATDVQSTQAEPPDDSPALTFAAVADRLQAAKGNADALDLAADMIGSVADEGQRGELAVMYRELKAKA